MSRLKRSGFLSKLVFFVGLLLLWSLVKSFLGFGGAYRRVDEAKKMLENEENKNKQLKDKFEEVQKNEYIEKVIRNELNMQMEGETIVVLPDNKQDEFPQARDDEDKKKNWEKWWNLVK